MSVVRTYYAETLIEVGFVFPRNDDVNKRYMNNNRPSILFRLSLFLSRNFLPRIGDKSLHKS